MPVPTLQVWNELVAFGKSLGGFKDVRRLPLNKAREAKFLEDLPGLKLPALLYIFKGRADTGGSAPVQRDSSWSAVIAVEDPKGAADEKAAALLDLHDGLFGRHLCEDGAVWVMAGNNVQVAETEPRLCVIEVAFTTRERFATLRSEHG